MYQGILHSPYRPTEVSITTLSASQLSLKVRTRNHLPTALTNESVPSHPLSTMLLARRWLLSSRRVMSTLIPTTSTRPQNWKASAPDPLPNTSTFAAQPSLPKLPVPDLPATLTRLKEALKPLAKTEAEYATALTKIDAFGLGRGKVLQKRLLDRDAGRKHWLEEWWDDIAYLGYRESVCAPILHSAFTLLTNTQVVVNVSYYCTCPSQFSHTQLTPHPTRWLRPPTHTPTPNQRRASSRSSTRNYDLPPKAKAGPDQTGWQ